MSVDQRRLSFLTETHGLDWVSDQSGVGVQHLDSLASTGSALTPKDSLGLRAAYQRDAYERMKAVGFSASEADRFRWYTPEAVSERETAVREKVKYLAEGAYAAMTANLDRAGEDYDPEAVYYEAEESVLKGFQHSKLSYEEWMDYAV